MLQLAARMLPPIRAAAGLAERAMPRYFFNVECETFSTPDLVGRELTDDDAAWVEAHRLLNDVLTSGLGPNVSLEKPWIEVLDEEQRPIMLLPGDELPAAPTRRA